MEMLQRIFNNIAYLWLCEYRKNNIISVFVGHASVTSGYGQTTSAIVLRYQEISAVKSAAAALSFGLYPSILLAEGVAV